MQASCSSVGKRLHTPGHVKAPLPPKNESGFIDCIAKLNRIAIAGVLSVSLITTCQPALAVRSRTILLHDGYIMKAQTRELLARMQKYSRFTNCR